MLTSLGEELLRASRQVAHAENDRLTALFAESWMILNATGERRGIAVIEHPLTFEEGGSLEGNDYSIAAIQNIEMRLDANVPWAHIFRFPSHDAYDAWVERGCPR